MEMFVHLHPEVFEIVLNKIKDVEVRVNDLKRRKLNIGDTLIFLKRPEEKEQIKAKVINLVYFNNFQEVIDYYDMKRIYLSNTTKEEYISLMHQFYSSKEVKEWGVVAIEFKIKK